MTTFVKFPDYEWGEADEHLKGYAEVYGEVDSKKESFPADFPWDHKGSYLVVDGGLDKNSNYYLAASKDKDEDVFHAFCSNGFGFNAEPKEVKGSFSRLLNKISFNFNPSLTY